MANNQILNKQLSLHYAGNSDNYQSFKRMIDASPFLYKHDYQFYNDTLDQRNKRNIQQIKFIKQILKEGKITSDMLNYNTFNTYYPSYILHHHYSIFVPLLYNLVNNGIVKQLYKQSQLHNITGAYFQYKLRTDFVKDQIEPSINKQGYITMGQNSYFYSAVTSPYLTHAAFIATKQQTSLLVIVQIRTKNGQLKPQIKVKDLGGTLSRDIIPVGYNFSGVKPLTAIPLNNQISKKFTSFALKQRFYQFNHTLKDLQKSVWITIKYTSMRRQFKTLQKSKQQRRIIQYQAVASRIIDGFAQLIAFSDLYTRLVQNNNSYVLYGQLLQSSHHIVLQNLIHLRQCCGGFGFLQYSGHPGCIQRVCFRAGSQSTKMLKLDALRVGNYFSNSEQSQKYFIQQIKSQTPTYMQYFGAFISICKNMRKEQNKMSVQNFKRNYLIQSSIMAMHARQDFFRHDSSNIHCLLLQYFLASYIIKNISFLDWSFIKIKRNVFFQKLNEYKLNLLTNIMKDIQFLASTLQLKYLRNVIIGRQDSQQFYNELLAVSKSNGRNHKQYVDYIRQPIVNMIVQNRAKL